MIELSYANPLSSMARLLPTVSQVVARKASSGAALRPAD
jgi:hypothetical protein